MGLCTTLIATTLFTWLAPSPRWSQEADDTPEVIRLKVGTEVVGVITDDGFDEAKGVKIRRVDDDSLLEIGFDQMLPEDALRIRQSRGFLPDEPEPLMVDAMRVKLSTGDELVGRIVEHGVETLKLRIGTKEWDLVRARVLEIVPVKVDALEVYDPEELFGQKLAAEPPQAALDWYNLGLFAESLQLWTHVKESLAQSVALDPAFKAEIISGKVKRAELRLESAEESALLAKAQRMASREKFDDALKVVGDFLEKKPNSVLRGDFEKTRKVFERQRAKWLKTQVIVNFFTFLERTARGLAADKASAIKSARKEMEQNGTTKAIEATAAALGVQPGEVQMAWEDPKRNTASPHYANYGSGTWTLGSIAEVTKGLVKEDPNAAANAAKGNQPSEQGESLEDKIAKIIAQRKKEAEEAAKRAKQGGKGPQQQQPRAAEIADIPPTEEDWWASITVDERTQYLLAWWADHDTHRILIKVDYRPCITCAQTGVIRYIDRNGDNKWVPCPRCKGAQIDRILRYH